MRKLGKGGKENNLLIILIIGGLLLAYFGNIGGLQDWISSLGSKSSSSSNEPSQSTMGTCPSDGITTYTLNVQDALTSTATNVDVEYFIFNGNKLIKEGTTGSDGSVDVDLTCGKDYTLLIINTTTTSGCYPVTKSLSARTSADTVNAEVIRFGGADIVQIENPLVPGLREASFVAGTISFRLKFKENETDRGYNKPVILCQANITSVESVKVNSFDNGKSVIDATSLIPDRILATSGYKFYAFQYPEMLTEDDGTVTANLAAKAKASDTPGTTDAITCYLADSATWKTSAYKTTSSITEAFKEGLENTENSEDVGGYDATANYYYFNGTL